MEPKFLLRACWMRGRSINEWLINFMIILRIGVSCVLVVEIQRWFFYHWSVVVRKENTMALCFLLSGLVMGLVGFSSASPIYKIRLLLAVVMCYYSEFL